MAAGYLCLLCVYFVCDRQRLMSVICVGGGGGVHFRSSFYFLFVVVMKMVVFFRGLMSRWVNSSCLCVKKYCVFNGFATSHASISWC